MSTAQVGGGTSFDIPAAVEAELRAEVRSGRMTVRRLRLVLSHRLVRAVPFSMAELLYGMYREEGDL